MGVMQEAKQCQHIYKLNPFSREKKCMKCGLVSRDFGVVRQYKKHLTNNYKINIW